jgi:hypothetical protein
MVNYQLGKVYKLECLTTGQVYYGATCEPILSRRLAGHKSDYEYYKRGHPKSYVSSFEILKNGNYAISLVENVPCNSKDELSARERYYIVNNVCVNKCFPLGKPKIRYTNEDVEAIVAINQDNWARLDVASETKLK